MRDQGVPLVLIYKGNISADTSTTEVKPENKFMAFCSSHPSVETDCKCVALSVDDQMFSSNGVLDIL